MTVSVDFRELSICYPRTEFDAVSDVSFTADPGFITAVVGPNGSGKSTIVKALIRRIRPHRGSIYIDDRDLSRISLPEFARSVAVVTQREDVQMALPVREFVGLGRSPYLGPFSRMGYQDSEAVSEALYLSGTEHLGMRTVDKLSGGEWQRVRIARALAQNTGAIVIDEPTTFLDIAHEMAVFELLDKLAHSGKTVLIVSHQLNLVARFAKRVVLISAGRIAASGSVDEIMRGDILESVYQWPLVVNRDPAVGAPALLPLRKRSLGGR